MKTQVSPVVIGIAVALVLVLCIFLFVRAINSYGPNQLPPPTDKFQPGYNAGGDRNAGPGNREASALPRVRRMAPNRNADSPRRTKYAQARLLSLLLLPMLACAPGCRQIAAGLPPVPAGGPAEASGFKDVSATAGLNYTWVIPGKRPLNILQTIGNGCAFLDYNNDGNLDILLVGPKLALYRGDGHGHFTDVTHETGLDRLSGHFLGCAVGDYDNDGYDDLYVSGYRTGVLLHNEHGAGFRDVTRAAGLEPQPWGTSCAFAETHPGSGRLDLYICNYAVFDDKVYPQLCKEKGILTSCNPHDYKPIRGVLYLNDGFGHFHDATKASGLAAATGRALGVAFLNDDGTGAQNLAIADDELQGDLFQPMSPPSGTGNLHYVNVADRSGTAYDRDGNVHGGMGMDWGDYDNDGRLDLFVATFANEARSLYHNEGHSLFRDVGFAAGLGATTSAPVAFGCKFLDYDNDGWLDLVIANGHVEDNVQAIQPTETYRQTAQLLHNQGGSPVTFEDISRSTGGSGFTRPIVGRGLAIGDFDNDGRIDVLIVDSEGNPLLLHNEVDTGGRHYLGLKLTGKTSNRDGYGATVTAVLSDGRRLVRVCHADGSYLSSSDRRVHIGLGSAARLVTLTVRWPSGHIDTFNDVAADRYVSVQEGDPNLKNLW